MPQIEIRLLEPTDDLAALTSLLHRAYKELAEMGLRFVATQQDLETTRERVQEGSCYVAEIDGRIVGTIVYRNPQQTNGCAWYDRLDVASFGQFGVEPEMKRMGVGSALLDHVERIARTSGATELALDTAEPAHHLIELYSRRGYRIVEHIRWDVVNYPSIVMSKTL